MASSIGVLEQVASAIFFPPWDPDKLEIDVGNRSFINGHLEEPKPGGKLQDWHQEICFY